MHIHFGVIRLGWGVEGGGGEHALRTYAGDVDGVCFYSPAFGIHFPSRINWEGMQSATEPGDRIGMLLDFEQGSMTVWKNAVKLGLMRAEGLSRPLCWAVALGGQGTGARIESAPAPASPTEEDPTAAEAWQRRSWPNYYPRRPLPNARRLKQQRRRMRGQPMITEWRLNCECGNQVVEGSLESPSP